jgi:hypothetical protein
MEAVCLGELFDGLIGSVLQGMHPAMGADDGLDQALVMRGVRSIISFQHGCVRISLMVSGDFRRS